MTSLVLLVLHNEISVYLFALQLPHMTARLREGKNRDFCLHRYNPSPCPMQCLAHSRPENKSTEYSQCPQGAQDVAGKHTKKGKTHFTKDGQGLRKDYGEEMTLSWWLKSRHSPGTQPYWNDVGHQEATAGREEQGLCRASQTFGFDSRVDSGTIIQWRECGSIIITYYQGTEPEEKKALAELKIWMAAIPLPTRLSPLSS